MLHTQLLYVRLMREQHNTSTEKSDTPIHPHTEKEQFHPHSTLLIVLALVIVGTVGQMLVSDEKFDVKKMLGELLLAGVGAMGLWAYGILQEFHPAEQVLYGSLLALGGVRALEWVIKAIRLIKQGPT